MLSRLNRDALSVLFRHLSFDDHSAAQCVDSELRDAIRDYRLELESTVFHELVHPLPFQDTNLCLTLIFMQSRGWVLKCRTVKHEKFTFYKYVDKGHRRMITNKISIYWKTFSDVIVTSQQTTSVYTNIDRRVFHLPGTWTQFDKT